MPERRGTRLVVEALFLVALAAALAFARLDPLEIAGGMLLGWLVVAAVEWAAWRAEPHYGSGLPPRYYVPAADLPPPQPLEQVDQGYPGAAREEAPTWIASPALRAEVLGEWPVAAPVHVDEDEADVESEEEADDADEADVDAFVPAAEEDADPWLVAELPGEPEPEEVVERAALVTVTVPAGTRTARYTLDPLPDPPPRKRFRPRGEQEQPLTLEVPARPGGPRPLPGAAERS